MPMSQLNAAVSGPITRANIEALSENAIQSALLSRDLDIAASLLSKPVSLEVSVQNRFQTLLPLSIRFKKDSKFDPFTIAVKLVADAEKLVQVTKQYTDQVEESASIRLLKSDTQNFFKRLTGHLQRNQNKLEELTQEFKTDVEFLRTIATPESQIRFKISAQDLEQILQDIHNGLSDKACDQHVERILELYGHRNDGEYLEDRRSLRKSRWSAASVPDEIKGLVKYRRTASDSELHAEHVVGQLSKAVTAIREQSILEQQASIIATHLTEEPNDLELVSIIIGALQSEFEDTTLVVRLKKLELEYRAYLQESAIANLCLQKLELLENELGQIFAERHKSLQLIESEREQALKLQLVDSLLASPVECLNKINGMSQASEKIALMRDLAIFGREQGKNELIEALQKQTEPPSTGALLEFQRVELEALESLSCSSVDQAFDSCVAILPRTLVIANIVGDRNFSAKMLQSLTLKLNLPNWITDWVNFRERELGGFLQTSIAELSKEIVAYGRMHGCSQPLPACLTFKGASLRRCCLDRDLRYFV